MSKLRQPLIKSIMQFLASLCCNILFNNYNFANFHDSDVPLKISQSVSMPKDTNCEVPLRYLTFLKADLFGLIGLNGSPSIDAWW